MREKIRLVPSRQRIWLGCIASSLLVGLGCVVVHHGDPLGWFLIILFALGVFAPLLLLRRDASWLELDENGFILCLASKPDRFLWGHIAEVAIWQGVVSFKLHPEHRGNRTGQSLARGISGYDGANPNIFGLAPQSLLGLMIESRQNQRMFEPPAMTLQFHSDDAWRGVGDP